jgi:L-2-hydroxyglutarate oxidase
MPNNRYNAIIVGGGIVGVATARALLLERPELKIVLLEKESALAAHQTGHNSGVIHAGVYYKPGSLKASLCIAGAERMREFAESRNIPYQSIGKTIVAVKESQLPALESLWERSIANGVPGITRLTAKQIEEHEPNAKGVAGLWSPSTGIIDYTAVTLAYADDFRTAGGEIVLNAKVLGAKITERGCQISSTAGDYEADILVNCAGLYSDKLALMTGTEPGVRITPFRGEYYTIKPERQNLVKGLIYPVPDPQFPFLGVHFTRTVHGSVEAGPNAVLALAREGYSKSDLSIKEFLDTLSWPGFQKLALRFWRTGLDEMRRSASKKLFAASLAELLPSITADDLAPGGAGIRAQAIDINGKLVDDFHIVTAPRAVHVLNVPSPAATASLAIADNLAAKILVEIDR